MGRIGDWMEKNAMWGFSPRTIRKNHACIPLFACVALGVFDAFVYSTRVLRKNPDCTFNNRKNHEPYNMYRDGTYYKLLNISGVILPCEAPNYLQPGDPLDVSARMDD